MSKIGLLTSYGLRDASKSRVILALVIVSLSISFATVLIVSSIMGGFRSMLVDGAIGTFSDLTIDSKDMSQPIQDIGRITAYLDSLDNVSAWSLRSPATVAVIYDGKTFSTSVMIGVNPTEEPRTTDFKKDIVKGTFLTPGNQKEMVLGIQFADTLVGTTFDGVMPKIGDPISVVTFSGKRDDLTVGGLMDTKGFMGNLSILMNKDELDTLGPDRKDGQILVKLKDGALIDQTKKDIESQGFAVDVHTWNEEAGYVDSLLTVIGTITSMINYLLIAAVFVIICIIVFINVFQKRRQIGIMKSMGAGSPFIVSIYMFETFVYSVLSYIIGFLLFMLVYSYTVQHPFPTLIGDFKLALDWHNVIQTSIVLFIATIGGSFFPAFIAAKTRIVEVLRGE